MDSDRILVMDQGKVSNKHVSANKHLMTGPKGNSEFCFPEILMFEGRGETKLTVSRGASH